MRSGFDSTVPYMTLVSGMAEMSVPDFAEKLALLADNDDLRCSLGEAGRKRATQVYDWSQVIPQYEEFWAELDAIRRAATKEESERYKDVPSPVAPPVFDFFACYPSTQGFAPGVTSSAEDNVVERLKLIYQTRNYSTVKRSPLNLQAADELLKVILGWKKKTGLNFAKLVSSTSQSEEIVEKTLVWLVKFDLIQTKSKSKKKA